MIAETKHEKRNGNTAFPLALKGHQAPQAPQGHWRGHLCGACGSLGACGAWWSFGHQIRQQASQAPLLHTTGTASTAALLALKCLWCLRRLFEVLNQVRFGTPSRSSFPSTSSKTVVLELQTKTGTLPWLGAAVCIMCIHAPLLEEVCEFTL